MLNLKKNETKLLIYFAQYLYILSKNYYFSSFISFKEIIYESVFAYIGQVLAMLTLHTPLRFNSLRDLIAYDRPEFFLRTILVYILRNTERDFDIRIRFSTKSQITIVPTTIYLLLAGQWPEREIYDLFGIKFFGNIDMRKILSDYSFWGFAGRKDFPLVGITSFIYSLTFLRVTKVSGNLTDLWSIFFQKLILNDS